MEKHASPKVFVYNTGERLRMSFSGSSPEREFQRGWGAGDPLGITILGILSRELNMLT